MVAAVRAAKEASDLVVVNCHWGLSAFSTANAMGIPFAAAPNVVTDYQHEMGRALVDAGASLVVGNHPHRLQGVECYRGGYICYSLGNFAFAISKMPHFVTTTAVLRCRIEVSSKSLRGISLLPVTLDAETYRPSMAVGADAERILRELKELSSDYETQFELSEDEIRVTPR